MKAIKTKILATSLAALTCASFTVVPSRDEELRRVSGKQAIVSDECFDNFLKNLKDVKAIIYIPDTKLVKGKDLNLDKVESKNDTVNLSNYILVQPVVVTGDDCSSKTKVTFDDLNMIVFVDKSYADKLSKMNLSKVEIKWFNTTFKVQHSKLKIGDKLNVLIDSTTAGYTPVEYGRVKY